MFKRDYLLRTTDLRLYFTLLFVLPVLLLTMPSGHLTAQGDDASRSGITTEGKEFWIVFQKNFRDFKIDDDTDSMIPTPQLHLELFITASKTARGYVEVKGIGFRHDFTVNAGQVISIKIDSAAQLRSSEKIEDLAVHVVSDETVAVYGLSHRYQTTDTYLAYPVTVLGKTYRAMGYKWLADDLLSQLAIIGTEDGTTVDITPSVRTRGGKRPGQTYQITLNKGQTYQIIPYYNPAVTSADLTGSLVSADKPIAVFSGHNCAYVPDRGTKACNLLVEQMPPVQSWGKQFYVGTLAGRASSVLRILANEDGTEVFENNRKVATLNAGQFYENPRLKEHTMVTSSKPILVAQFSKGYTAVGTRGTKADSVGDPMMIVVAPTEQFLSSYRFATPVKGSWDHYINVIAPTASLNSLKLNGEAVDPNRFTQFGISRYSIGQLLIGYGTYSITGSEPFGLYSYGFGYADKVYDAYGNGGGQSMIKVYDTPDKLPPTIDATNDPGLKSILGIVRDDRLNDKGIELVEVVGFDNVKIDIIPFEKGAPQSTVQIRPVFPRQDASARFRLTDRAGNVGNYTLCLQYDELADSMMITVLEGDKTCDFLPPIHLGGYFKYSAIDNHVTIPIGSQLLNNPVELNGNHGVPVNGIGIFGDYAYNRNVHLTAKIGLDFWNGDLFGYWPDSLRQVAEDGTPIAEEFQLDRSTTLLTITPGVRWFPFSKTTYLFGDISVSLPISVSEKYTRAILSPSNYTYENNQSYIVDYEGSGPSGFSLLFTPEAGVGVSLPVARRLTIFGELGGGFSLNSISPDRDWKTSYLFGRIGAKTRISL